MPSFENVLLGSLLVLISGICLLANFIVLWTIARYSEFYVNSSYKIMLLMGVFDVSQLCSHFATGIFTIAQFDAGYYAYKVFGIMISPAYECYVFVTILLAFNRFLFMCYPWKETVIFSKIGCKLWLALVTLIFTGFAILHASNKIYSRYLVDKYEWSYDKTNFEWSAKRQQIIFYYQVFGIFIAWIFYVAITVKLLFYRNHVDSITRFVANRKILFHAFAITVYSTLMNIAWHKIDLVMSPGNIQNFIINMTWVGSAGLSPFLSLAFNKSVSSICLF
ncbi:hypothetical protein L596_008801 [Steinernema carpocapsae]|uniref:G-protein coupled receptors family 1 profile domain-containing protein n=1 Tax=Steinernema carpocapsae TaxID=34508 RepID=A0A4U5PDJ5_STECR|nr:hypothetical protein L596_008801 [Steinernema carpocapsae]